MVRRLLILCLFPTVLFSQAYNPKAGSYLVYDVVYTDIDVDSAAIKSLSAGKNRALVSLNLTSSVTGDKKLVLPDQLSNNTTFLISAKYATSSYNYYLTGTHVKYEDKRIEKYYLEDGETVIGVYKDSVITLNSATKLKYASVEDIKNSRIEYGGVIYSEGGYPYQVSTYPIFGHSKVSDGIIQFETKAKYVEGQNLFTQTNGVGNDNAPWLYLGVDMTYTASDTLHPVTDDFTAGRFTLNSTEGSINYNETTLGGYYAPDSVYTISFWARKGAGTDNSNVSMEIALTYLGAGSPTQAIALTDSWQQYNLQLTALDNTRTFNYVTFRFLGDSGDYAFFTQPNIRRGSYDYAFFAETRDSVFTGEKVYVNAILENSAFKFDQFRDAKETERKSLQYVIDECRSITGCNKVLLGEDLTIDSTILLQEGVILVGGFTGWANAGDQNYTIQGTNINLDLNNENLVAFEATGTSQIAGIGMKNIRFQNLSKAKALFSSGDALGFELESLSVNVTDTGRDSLTYGVILETGNLYGSVINCELRARDVAVIGTSSEFYMQDSRVLQTDTAVYVTGGTGFTFDNCWFEKLNGPAIVFNALSGTLDIEDMYTEDVPGATSSSNTLVLLAAENVNISNSLLNNSPAALSSHRAIQIDTVGATTITGSEFVNYGDYPFVANSGHGTIIAVGNSFSETTVFPSDWTDIADSSKIISLGNVKKNATTEIIANENYVSSLVSKNYRVTDGYIVAGLENTELNGDLNLRADTINLIGTQNLLTRTEELNVNNVGDGWNGLGVLNITADDTLNTDGQMKADLIVYGSGSFILRSNNTSTNTSLIKNSTPYTIRYEARKPFGAAATTTVKPYFDSVGGGVNGITDTITTSWQTFTQTFIAPSSGASTFNFELQGDSIWITKVSLSEGYTNDVYTENLSSITEKKQVVYDGTMNVVGAIGVNGYMEPSAIMDLNSTNKGFLPPRMTTTQRDAITAPATGLIIYNITTSKHQGYDGTVWNDFY